MFVEIRLHGRGGQGIVTASEMLVEAAAIEGYYGQSIPIFGAERRGAPVVASARVSDKLIRRHSQIYSPDIVAVFDPLFASRQDVTAGLKNGGVLLINHRQKPDLPQFKVIDVDATKIALENGLIVAGWAVVNTAMLGALARVLGIISKEALEKVVRGRWKGELGEKNLRAALTAFQEVNA
jgi:pyruvate ferredoxin oxidoreductase gamma subunit